MSRRHRVRLMLEETRYVCSARGCKFSGTYAEGVVHIREELRKREAESEAA